jgi:RNA-directed DNA polymerase
MDQLLTDLFRAYFNTRKNKRNTREALEFEINYEKEIFKLYQEIKEGSYEISESIIFIVFDPVQREIVASSFRDRVVHHLVFDYINPIFESGFINDSYSCRKGKGPLYGIRRVNHFIRACSDNYQKDAYVLKLDISGYFMSIDKNILWEKIKERLWKEKEKCNFDFYLVLSLIEKIVFHDYTKNYLIKGMRRNWAGLPKNKSLFFSGNNCGLPIGNLTSQLFSNIYLNDFDHFVKRSLKFKYYGRYVDDFVLIHKDKEFLKKARLQIEEYLGGIGLKLHPRKIYLQDFNKGFKFLGVVIKPFRIYIINRTKSSFYNKIKKEKSLENYFKLFKNINSYLGLFGHYNSYNLRKKIFQEELRLFLRHRFRVNDKYSKIVFN